MDFYYCFIRELSILRLPFFLHPGVKEHSLNLPANIQAK
ncbi:hypothetical protein LEP1GSC170_5235 [Leptospira interrogans serovar Bataviae str. HAI135]|nr:hypothetical protein LEP1GSC170_5235 [Leptospira interrogans serovar Bataviae str. HAI135]